MTRFMKLALLGTALAVPATSAFADSINGSIGESGAATITNNGTIITSVQLNSGNVSAVGNTPGSTIYPYFQAGNSTTTTLSFSMAPNSPAVFTTGATGSGTTTLAASSTALSGGTLLFSAYDTSSNKYLNFFVDSYYTINNTYVPAVNAADNMGSVTIFGTGYFTETGYSPTNASFSLNANQAGTVTFSSNQFSTVAATPEPSSLMLLGTGLVSAAGYAIRKRKLA